MFLLEVDVRLRNEGTLFLITPLTELARQWFAEHLPEDALTWGDATVVEHRFIGDIVEGLLSDGLVVE